MGNRPVHSLVFSMITKIGEKDKFGYDDNERPLAVKIAPGVIVFGYAFCGHFASTLSAGLQHLHHLYKDKGASIVIYSPQAKRAEVWFGKWTLDKDLGHYSIIDPSYHGVTRNTFDSLDVLKTHLQSGNPIQIVHGYLQIAGHSSDIVRPDLSADSQLQSRLKNATHRLPALSVDKTKFEGDEQRYIEDIQYLLKNLFDYVYRVRAAVELNKYADTMHFAVPPTIPPSPEKFSLLMEWKSMAARDAAFSVFHFQRTFERFREQIPRRCPQLRKHIDFGKLRTAWKLYRSWFKYTVPLRHAIGHSAEFYMTVEDRARHATHEDIFVESMMLDTVLSVPSSGEFVSIDVSSETVKRLERVRTLILESYSFVLK